MNVTDAVLSRFSCRAFRDIPVPQETVREILDIAHRAPSGGNLQPWLVHVLAGDALDDLKARIRPRLDLLPKGEGADYNVYPADLAEPYRGRRFKCGADLYAALGIAREDQPARLKQFARNFEFFGAPVGLFFLIDRRMGPPQWSDLGMYVQTVMLLARERGLHTCAQEAWTSWHRTVADALALPEHIMVFCGMALGYIDEDDPVNGWRTERAAFEDFVSFAGFDGMARP